MSEENDNPYQFKLDFNTIEAIKRNRESLKDCENYPILNDLENAWQVLSLIESSDDFTVDRDDYPAETPLEIFCFYVEMGCYPPPEIMLAITDCFRLYMNNAGNLSLDDIFNNGKAGKKNNIAFNKRKRMLMLTLDTNMYPIYEKTENGGRKLVNINMDLSAQQIKKAENYIQKNKITLKLLGLSEDPESLIRTVRRWKKEIIENGEF